MKNKKGNINLVELEGDSNNNKELVGVVMWRFIMFLVLILVVYNIYLALK